MRKVFTLTVMLICFGWMVSSSVMAHQAAEMLLKYIPEEKNLYVEVYHRVDNTYTHYINKYRIKVNNGVPTNYRFRGQDNEGVAIQQFKISTLPGDIIKVQVYCNQEGILEQELFLTEKYKTEDGLAYIVQTEKPDRGYLKRILEDRQYNRLRATPITTTNETIPPTVPEGIIDENRKRQFELEQEINRKAYEAKFGPLQTPP